MIMDIPKLTFILHPVVKSSKAFLLHCSSPALLILLASVAGTIGLQVGYWNLIECQVFW